MDWSLSFNLELEAKFVAKSLALSDEGEITSEPFIMEDIDILPLLSSAFTNFQNWRNPSFLFTTLARAVCA